MTTDREQDEDERPISYPISEDDAAYLLPKLYLLACRYSKSQATRDDLVQTTMLALIDGKRKWKNVMVVAQSSMIDWLRKEKRLKYPALKGKYADRMAIEEFLLDRLEEEEIEAFKGLGLSTDQRLTAIMYWTKGMLQSDIAVRLGVSPTTISTSLKTVKEAVRKRWMDN